MVTIIDFKTVTNDEDEPFNALILQGEVESVKSKETGMYYLTAKKTRIPSTFDEQRCEELIGTQLPGEIQRVPCEPYEYEISEDEKIVLEHTYEYNPEPVTSEEHIFENNTQDKVAF